MANLVRHKILSFLLLIMTLVWAACSGLSNKVDALRIQCGEEGYDEQEFLTVYSPDGAQLKRSDMEVKWLDSEENAPMSYEGVSPRGCIAKPESGFLIVRSLLEDAASFMSSDELKSARAVVLHKDHARHVAYTCGPQNPVPATHTFSIADVLQESLPPHEKRSMRLKYALTSPDGENLDGTTIALSEPSDKWFPFRSGWADGLYRLEMKVQDLTRPDLEAEHICFVKLDNTPPQSGIDSQRYRRSRIHGNPWFARDYAGE